MGENVIVGHSTSAGPRYGPVRIVQACKTTAGRDGWLAFFRDLTARGLTGVRLVTFDAHRGLVEAIGVTLPGAA